MLLGARVLWGVIRQYSFRDGRCYASDETLARRLAVSDRQLIRYLRILENSGLLRSVQRPGKTPIRELLWAARFAGKIPVRGDVDVRGGRHPRQGGLTSTSPLYKEEGVLNGSLEVKRDDGLKKPWLTDSELRANKPAVEWTEEDYLRRGRECGFPEHVIQRDIERLRARKANAKAERMTHASEIKPGLN
jgi:hypothetical protein